MRKRERGVVVGGTTGRFEPVAVAPAVSRVGERRQACAAEEKASLVNVVLERGAAVEEPRRVVDRNLPAYGGSRRWRSFGAGIPRRGWGGVASRPTAAVIRRRAEAAAGSASLRQLPERCRSGRRDVRLRRPGWEAAGAAAASGPRRGRRVWRRVTRGTIRGASPARAAGQQTLSM